MHLPMPNNFAILTYDLWPLDYRLFSTFTPLPKEMALTVVVRQWDRYQTIRNDQISGGTAHRNGPHAPPSGRFARNKLFLCNCAPFWWSYSDETYIRRFSIIKLVGVQHIVMDLTRHLVAVLPEIYIFSTIAPPSGGRTGTKLMSEDSA